MSVDFDVFLANLTDGNVTYILKIEWPWSKESNLGCPVTLKENVIKSFRDIFAQTTISGRNGETVVYNYTGWKNSPS